MTGNIGTTEQSSIGIEKTPSDVVPINHPYYLNASDSPGMNLLNVSFDGTSYGNWKRGILISLSAKNKLCFINDKSEIPKEDSTLFDQWRRCNDMVIAWLLNSLSKDIAESLIYSLTASYLWNELEESCESKYFDDEPLPSVGQAYSILLNQESQREVHSGNLVGTDSTAFSVNKWNDRRSFNTKKESTQISYPDSSHPRNSQNTNQGNNLFCTYCKKTNHTISNCYKLIGYPEGYKFTNKPKKPMGNARVNAVNAAEEISGANVLSFQRNNIEIPEGQASKVKGMNKHSAFNINNFSKEQCQQLIDMFTSVQNGTGSQEQHTANMAGISKFFAAYTSSIKRFQTSPWIIDTGASHHMTFDKSLFHSFKLLPHPVSVTLPNSYKGHTIQRKQIFGEAVGGLFLLKGHTSATMSTSSLLHPLENKVINSSSFSSVSPVGSKVQSVPTIPSSCSNFCNPSFMNEMNCNSQNFVSNKLWHFRLGHLPYISMQKILGDSMQQPKIFDFPCDICPMARQTKLPFPNSRISSQACFDMIHIDTWGPYKTQTYKGEKYFLTIADDFSRTTWTYLLSSKSNAFPVLKSYLAYVERQFGKKVKVVRSDNAYELGSGHLPSDFFLYTRYYPSNHMCGHPSTKWGG
ncbi:uncharacterized protein LOC132628984 [Lycium barbarum]|uniref:uncharacterized protein LOC132628984 n=1 Tax=Lycium barbarum TaxID=112863 RepID=UPI00293E3107|nr:uncharacterized protein LOC132628984 [Lycium barbarum]